MNREQNDPGLCEVLQVNWTLAAWNVDQKRHLATSQTSVGEGDFVGSIQVPTMASELSNPQSSIMAQSLSLIDYTLQSSSTDPSGDRAQPLQVNIFVHVWSYGLGSRTSKLGVVIAIAGCLIVLAKLVIVLATRTVSRDPLRSVMTALEYPSSPPPSPSVGGTSWQTLEEEAKLRLRFIMRNEPEAEVEIQK